MRPKELIEEINKLSKEERFFIIEQTLAAIRKEEINSKMRTAASKLYEDYVNDSELTTFTVLDSEDFINRCLE